MKLDPALFAESSIPPETRSLNEGIVAAMSDMAEWWDVGAKKVRDARAAKALFRQRQNPIARAGSRSMVPQARSNCAWWRLKPRAESICIFMAAVTFSAPRISRTACSNISPTTRN
jgi:hypothetical protein